jgi:hypothetical protein
LSIYKKAAPPKNQAVEISSETFQKLGSEYCISYGNPSAPVNVVEFFSFQCPHCVRLFRDEIHLIKEEMINTGKLHLAFHPVPQDLSTVQALVCLEKLSPKEKQLFLEVILEEAEPGDPELMTKLMMAAMNVFKKPIPELGNEIYLQEHPVFEKVYQFLKQGKIFAVPTAEVNGRLFSEVPDFQFLNAFCKDPR